MRKLNDHQKRVAAFPEDIQKAHAHCTKHRAELMASTRCGCFYCCVSFAPSEVVDWIDEDASGTGQTALCPKCGIDSVIGDKSGYEPAKEFLKTMHEHWF